MYKNPKNMTKLGQKLDKICHNTYKMWQTEDKNWTTFVRTHIRCGNWGQKLDNICQNTYKMWQTGYKICHYKNTISVRYVTITLMYQTIVTKFVTSGQKCDKIQIPTNRVVMRFLACVENFVTSWYSLSRVCPHFVTSQNPVISTFVRVLTPNVTKLAKLLTIFIFFKKIC